MKGYSTQLLNNILEKKHVASIGAALWEYIWCLDRVTQIDENNLGYVLGGKPIKWKHIKEDLGKHEVTIGDNIAKLAKHKYLIIKRTPFGHTILVTKCKKQFKKTKENTVSDKGKHLVQLRKTLYQTKENTRNKEDVFSMTYSKDSTEDQRNASKEAKIRGTGMKSIGDIIKSK